jgi:hypothetical protein
MLTACGGDSGSGSAAQAQETCMNLCNKNNECNKLNFNCNDFCSSKNNPASGAGGSTGSSSCDVSKLIDKENACINGSCNDFNSCTAAAQQAACGITSSAGGSNGTGASSSGTGASSSGTGASTGSSGSNGSGASTGSGGSSGGATDCSVCDQAASCCMSAGVGASCTSSFSKASCDMEPSSLKSTVIQACQTAVDAFKQAGGCK